MEEVESKTPEIRVRIKTTENAPKWSVTDGKNNNFAIDRCRFPERINRGIYLHLAAPFLREETLKIDALLVSLKTMVVEVELNAVLGNYSFRFQISFTNTGGPGADFFPIK